MGKHITLRIERSLAAAISQDLKEANYHSEVATLLSSMIDVTLKSKSSSITVGLENVQELMSAASSEREREGF